MDAAPPVPDPRAAGKTYRRTLGLWEPGRAQNDGPVRVVSFHYEDAADAPLARRTARLCARLLRLHLAHFGERAPFPRQAPEAHVFLRRDAPPGALNAGGQTWGENVWLFSTGRPRTDVEWTRTVAHEWGHLTLYAARGYREPENDAAGFLGERLYLKWLREEGTAPVVNNDEEGDGVDRAGLDIYHERQIAPLIARFRAAGPNAPALLRADRDARAMDLYVGAALAFDDAFGSLLLSEALGSVLGDDGPRPFLDSVRRAVAARPVLPVRLPAWVPLARAAYRLSPDAGAGRGAATRKIAVADRPPLVLGKSGAPPAQFSVRAAGWKWVRALPNPAAEIGVRLQREGGASSSKAAGPR